MIKKILLPIATLLFLSHAEAQNIGINVTGAAPNTSALLDVDATGLAGNNKKGVLIPRVTAAERGLIPAPANGLLVYETTTTSFWYFNGAIWVQIGAAGTDWALLGNALVGTEKLGSTNNQPVRLFSSNLERMRIQGTGQVAVNNVAPIGGDVFSAYAGAANFAVNGYSTAGAGAGVYGYAQNNNSIGLWGDHLAAGGTGTVGVGEGAGVAQTLIVGSGGAFTGVQFGMAAFRNVATNVNNEGGGYFVGLSGGLPQYAYVSFRTGNIWYKIIGTGTVSTIVYDPITEGKATMFAPEAAEILLMDIGHGQLSSGAAHIDLDPILSANILVDADHPLRVIVQVEGECNGVYVTNKSATGFDVVELLNGTSDVPFTWSVHANRADEIDPGTGQVVSANADARFPQAPEPQETQALPTGSHGNGALEPVPALTK